MRYELTRWSEPVLGLILEYTDPRTNEVSSAKVSWSVLDQLYHQDRWDSSFGSALTLPRSVQLACIQHGFAEKETRGGVHGTDKLRELMEREGWL